MAKPVPPTVPEPALRSQPDSFADNIEANILFWVTLVTYMNQVVDYADGKANALLTGNLPSLVGAAKDVLRINVGETGIELLPTSDVVNAVLEATDEAAIRTALELGTAARKTVGSGVGNLPELVDVAGQPGLPAIDGSQLLNLQVLGLGQTWRDLTASRSDQTTYQNTTSQPIAVYLSFWAASGVVQTQVSNDATTWFEVGTQGVGGTGINPCFFVVPPGGYYRVNGAAASGFFPWNELRGD